jgi:hypothetical protein
MSNPPSRWSDEGPLQPDATLLERGAAAATVSAASRRYCRPGNTTRNHALKGESLS